MSELLFLGTGPAWPKPGQGNTSFLLRNPSPILLVDCGPTTPFALSKAGVNWDDIHTILLTHRHGDHTLGLPILLLRFLQKEPSPLTVVGGGSAIEAARAIVLDVYPELTDRIHKVEWLSLAEDRLDRFELPSGIRLSTLPNSYPPGVPVLALRLDFPSADDSFGYTSDTAAAPHLRELFDGVELLIHEANFSAMLDPDVDYAYYGHGTARDAGRLATRSACRRLALVHLAARYAEHLDVLRAEAAEEFDGEIIIPQDGDALRI